MNNNQTNSGYGACEITRGGKRMQGVDIAVSMVQKYPGIDGFSCAWLHAGGDLEFRDGQYHLVGGTDRMGPAELAKVIKMQGRLTDAFLQKKIVKCDGRVKRSVKATGYRVAGGGVFPDPNLPKGIGKKLENKTDVRVIPAMGSVSADDKPVEKQKTVGSGAFQSLIDSI